MTTLLFDHFDQLISTPEDVVQVNRAILLLAMQGKLVEQVADDEPVDLMLKRLPNWSGKQFTNSACNNEKPYKLPMGWEWRTIGDVCQTTSGGTPSRQNSLYYGGTIPWLKSGELKDNLIEAVEEYITEEGLANSSAKIFPAGTPLIALYGATVGKTGLLGIDAATNQAVCALFPSKVVVDTHYLLKYLQSQRQKLIDISAGGAQPNISQKVIREWLIPIPPLAEQKRIVARVEELFAQTRLLSERLAQSRAELDRLNQSALAHLLASQTPEEFNERWAFIAAHFDLLTTAPKHVAPVRQAILELAVRGKLTCREPGDEPAKELLKRIKEKKEEQGITQSSIEVKEEEITFQLRKGWEWTRWDDVSLQIADVDHKMPNEVADGIPYVSPRDFKGKEEIAFSTAKKISREDYDNLASKIRPERGDIIFPRYGTIGVNRFVSVEFEFLASYSCAIIKHMKGLMNPRYVYFYSISPFLKQETQKYINKTTQANVGIKSIQKFVFPLPPLAEQERIVKRVEQLLSWCDALEGRLRSAEEERGRLVESVLAKIGV